MDEQKLKQQLEEYKGSKEWTACYEAFKANAQEDVSLSAWCCHHTVWWEELEMYFGHRLSYILNGKPSREHKTRFKNFRPCTQHEKVKELMPKYLEQKKKIQQAKDTRMGQLCGEHLQKMNLVWDEFIDAKAPLLEAYESKKVVLLKERDEKQARLSVHQPDFQAKFEAVGFECRNQIRPLWDEYVKQISPYQDEYEVKRRALTYQHLKDLDLLHSHTLSSLFPGEEDYEAQLMALYKQDVPEGTWNGKSIFSEGEGADY